MVTWDLADESHFGHWVDPLLQPALGNGLGIRFQNDVGATNALLKALGTLSDIDNVGRNGVDIFCSVSIDSTIREVKT